MLKWRPFRSNLTFARKLVLALARASVPCHVLFSYKVLDQTRSGALDLLRSALALRSRSRVLD